MRNPQESHIHLNEVTIDGESYFQITNVDQMRPFFMSIVSDSNHWMFIGSNGGISAGRKNSEHALFPYYTDDKIIESAEVTGSKSIFRINNDSGSHTWEPFSIRFQHLYDTTRNLYKSIYCNKIIFEEINHDLGLTFRYQWNSSNKFGFVRRSQLINNGKEAIQIKLVDGIQNIMPHGVGAGLQNQSSNLVDAYKRNEIESKSGIGIFALSAVIVDKAEPSEALKANIAWSLGLENPTHLLSSRQLDSFRGGKPIVAESDVKAERGAYFLSKELTIPGSAMREWMIVANVNQNVSSILALAQKIQGDDRLQEQIIEDIEAGTRRLIELNASSDALQLSNDTLKNSRHFSNTLFNIMRGGIFDDGYNIDKTDLIGYLKNANKPLLKDKAAVIDKLPSNIRLSELMNIAEEVDDPDLKRLFKEYLPLKFSRRHGDPSRPWNQFTINTHNEIDGSKVLDYEGNWRDIFQNWEALAHSFPAFIEGMIFRFLNASTFDGYNPYRITKHGIDWERIEADDPWSYIGYWGDHQIIYLLKFLEFSEAHFPGTLQKYFTEDVFVYANVPYKIKSYEEQLINPKDTIDFDHELDEAISRNKDKIGADASLISDKAGQIHRVNFAEKILATVLAKISNFIPEGGIWMNTQRPEWNDANNALVGNGVSVVTLAYLVRFLNFFGGIMEKDKTENIMLSEELLVLFRKMDQVLKDHRQLVIRKISDKERKSVLDGLGKAASAYRHEIYHQGFSGKRELVKSDEIVDFVRLANEFLIHTLRANRRSDNMYHAYNIMTVKPGNEISISYLSEMLEGQVAALSSGVLTSKEAVDLLDAMRDSALYREDQNSYLLYPEKELPGFLEKNNIPADLVGKSELLQLMLKNGDTRVIEKDIEGGYHFNGNFRNAGDLNEALSRIANSEYEELIQKERPLIAEIFESVFNHKSFTGRSGTFYGYEGLGSIYWHMVSKLSLAVQECCLDAVQSDDSSETINQLTRHYYEINDGIGVHKSPELYGAFPTDPYSHTPKNKGAQQPGMTGQVKEDILCRIGELGITVKSGQIAFQPSILKKSELLMDQKKFTYVDLNQDAIPMTVEKGSLCFTYCQIPVVYSLGQNEGIELRYSDGSSKDIDGLTMDESNSSEVFSRSGRITSIHVKLSETRFIA